MIRINEIKLTLNDDENILKNRAAKKLHIPVSAIKEYSIFKKSIDSRDKNDIKIVYSLNISLDGDEEHIVKKINNNGIFTCKEYRYKIPENKRTSILPPVIAGFGPSGMFAALILVAAGIKPIILERGEKVEERERTVLNFFKNADLNTESNIQFGEGGAGAFSDGKLTTGIKDKRIKYVYEQLVRFDAPKDILYSGNPHIGTDLLPKTVKNLREYLENCGAIFHFNTALTNIITYNKTIQGITIKNSDGSLKDIETDCLLLCTGHSADDTIKVLHQSGVKMERKPFSVGVRIEHKREFINKAQYGAQYLNPKLPTASYKMACHPKNSRGAYTFCMCPGGTVVAAQSEKNTVIVNGMSRYKRDDENSNSAILVGIDPEFFPDGNELTGFSLQREIEKKAFLLAGSNYTAPAETVKDFLTENNTPSHLGSVKPSYPLGISLCNLHRILPKKVSEILKYAIPQMAKKLTGFDMDDAVLTAPETRSSSPVRILRDEFFQTNIRGLYPCGEGAGYAGGIISAACDGIKVAEAVLCDEN